MSNTRELHPIAASVIALMTHEATDISEIKVPDGLAAEMEPALLALSGSEELRFALSGLLDFVSSLEHAGAEGAAKALLSMIETKRVLAAVRGLNERRSAAEHEAVASGKRRFLRLTDRKGAPAPAVIGAPRPDRSVTVDELGVPKYV